MLSFKSSKFTAIRGIHLHLGVGRQLQGITGADLAASYNYNENGLRTRRPST